MYRQKRVLADAERSHSMTWALVECQKDTVAS